MGFEQAQPVQAVLVRGIEQSIPTCGQVEGAQWHVELPAGESGGQWEAVAEIWTRGTGSAKWICVVRRKDGQRQFVQWAVALWGDNKGVVAASESVTDYATAIDQAHVDESDTRTEGVDVFVWWE